MSNHTTLNSPNSRQVETSQAQRTHSKALAALFEPLQVGALTLKNRIIMGSMHTGLEESPQGFERLAVFYEERARHQVGLIITGGIAPNSEGRVVAGACAMITADDAREHQLVTDAVHNAGGRICMQILHAGRYAYSPELVAPSAIQSPITPFEPKALSAGQIEQQLNDFVRCATLAQQAGYDGVEVMGPEGYFINQFLVEHTNKRDDEWGGDFAGRSRFALEVVRRIRKAVGSDFLIIFRISVVDLIGKGSTFAQTSELAVGLEAAGVDILNTGIGWHEARIPTIATSVPRGAFSWATRKLKQVVSCPVVACNRINTPEVAAQIIRDGAADLVSMARPFLADPEFVSKAMAGQSIHINTCIGCNQACLDHTFAGKLTSCLVNPLACHETEILITKAVRPLRVAIVGAGPAGLAAARVAALCGHKVELFEASKEIGGQFNFAKRVPGKEEFYETLRFFEHELARLEVKIHLQKRASIVDLKAFDSVILASGVKPRWPNIKGIDHSMVVGYQEVYQGAEVGKRVAIIGAGGIGFDTAEYLNHAPSDTGTTEVSAYIKEWGIDTSLERPGGLQTQAVKPASAARQIYLLQRKTSKLGAGLGKTTGWIHRLNLHKRGVTMLGGVSYQRIDDDGLHVEVEGQYQCLAVDTVVICSGQESVNELGPELAACGKPFTVIGGAQVATEIDAKRAISEGFKAAIALDSA